MAVSLASMSVPPEPSDPRPPAWVAWVESARAGDSAAFAKLHRDFGGMVHGLLLARVEPSAADDLTQEVFLNAWQGIEGLDEALAWPRWLAAIARRRAIDHQRKHPPPEPLPADLRADSSAENRSAAEQLLTIIRSLPESYVEPLLLRLVEGLSGPEIAERCDLSPGYVRVNLHRGMKLLRDRLETKP